MAKIYSCPGCGASMEYDADSGKMLCGHCGHTCEVEQVQSEDHESTEEYKVYHCSSCGAEMVTDDNTSATVCAFCGTPNLIESRLSGEWRPTKVIPFRISKKKAQEQFRAWTKKGLLTPGVFHRQSVLESICGMYVPFWLYDFDTRVKLDAHATKVRTIPAGDWLITYTDHFRVRREVEASYDGVPADASERMPDGVMDALEPFRYEDLKCFQMPYLAGFQAEKYDYDGEQLKPRAEQKLHDTVCQSARATISGYSTTNVVNQQVNMQTRSEDYVLLPVWLLSYQYRGERCTLTMNGQTGKIVGRLPVGRGKAAAWFAGTVIVVFAICNLIGGLI